MTENEALEILNNECEDIYKVQLALKVAREALKIVAKMKEHCEGSCTDCSYWNPKFDKCMNDLLKGVDGHE